MSQTQTVDERVDQDVPHVVEHNLPKPHADSDFIVFTDASLNAKKETLGVGWVVCRTDGTIVCYGSRGFERDCSINEGEALAVKCAVEQVKAMDWFDAGITVYSDSEAVVESFEQETSLWELDIVSELLENFLPNQVKWVKRDFNRIADALSGDARKQIES